jgi:hypothetical protein
VTPAEWVRVHPAVSVGLGWAVFAELAVSAPKTADLTGPVFGTAATLAALVLAVAALVNPFALTGLPQVARLVMASRTPTDASYAKDLAESIERSLARIPPAFNLLVAAFTLAAVALFRPDLNVIEPSSRLFQMPLTAALVGAAVALDLVALMMLVPVATSLADIGVARTIANTARQRLAELTAQEAVGDQNTSCPAAESPGPNESSHAGDSG